jgi:nicotinamidase-related amidase
VNRKRVLLVIDFFNPDGFRETPRFAKAALAAARRTAHLKKALQKRKVPTIYANDNFGRWQSEFGALVAQCRELPGATGEIATLLAPEPGDWSVLKPRHSAFYGTPLQFMLDELGADTLILTGVSADSCITMTAHDAHVRQFGVWTPRDCVASTELSYTRAALKQLKRVAGATTLSSAAVIAGDAKMPRASRKRPRAAKARRGRGS